jgi:hypothetical protein
MKIEINEGTPFLVDITAAENGKRYRLVVEDQGASALYRELSDHFGGSYWEGATNIGGSYRDIVGKIIVALKARRAE